MANDLINDMLKRPVRQSLDDGLNEIQFGIVFLLWGGILVALALLGGGLPKWTSWSWIIVIPVMLFSQALMPKLRARWVYPRIGYVKLHQPIAGKPVVTMIVGAVVGLFFVIAMVLSPQFRSSLPMFLGLIFAAGNFAWWMWLRIRRLLVYAILALASGLAAQWMLPDSVNPWAVMCAISMFYLVGGFLALRHLMRQPLPTEDRP